MNVNDLLCELSNITHDDNPDKIRKLFSSTRARLVVPKLVLEKGNIIFRASLITNISEINSPKRLSYKPASMNDTYQRASTPFNTMFYGIIGDNPQSAVMGCLGETCECLRDKESPNKHYKVVISQWVLNNDVALVEMIDIKGDNKSQAFGNHEETISAIEMLNDENEGENKAYLEFMSNQFKKRCRQESDYWISAIYTEFLTQIQGCDGIIYESVQAIDPALNEIHCIALTPNFVDNNLDFIRGDVYEFDFKGINRTIIPNKTGEIIFNDK